MILSLVMTLLIAYAKAVLWLSWYLMMSFVCLCNGRITQKVTDSFCEISE